MKNLKFFKNFNLDFFIIITIMIVSMTGFNVLFNVFFNAYNVTRQNKNFIEKNNHINISFKEELDSVRAKEFLKRIHAKGIEFATEKEVTLTGSFFDKRLNLNLVSDKNIFDYKVHKGKDLIDIKDDEKGIIIPELYKELVYEEENNYFINIKNEKFKVLGVIDNRFSEDYYSYRAFVPYDSSESFFDENLSGITITSSNSREELEHIIKADEAVKEIGFISPSYITVDAQLETVKQELNYYIFIGILCFINFILFFVFYLKKQDKKVGVLRAVGFNKKMVAKYFQKQILILGIVASFMAWALYYPFANFFNNSFMNLGLMPSELILLVDLIIVFALIIITYRINFFVLNNKNINNTIVSNKNILNGVMIKMLLIVQIVLMFNYSFDTNDIYADINKTLNKAKNVVDLENTLVVNPFTVPLSDEVLTNINVEEIEKSLQDKNIDFITYFYSLDYSNAVLGLNNIQELIDTLAIDSNITGYDLNDKEIPILYIDRASLDELNIKISIIKESSNKASTPVIAGYNYANKFKVGDKVLGESGVSYEIIGFLNKNENMFMTNSGTQIMSEFNNLDSFFVNV
ncbi:MAG: FtsX-like permease family protein, partial [Sarcina sp.]